MKFLWLYFCYIPWREILSPTSDYYDGLIKYLKKESKLHQVVFIGDDFGNKYPIMSSSLMTRVSSHFPSLSLKYSEMGSNLSELHSNLLERPRSTTLFVLFWKNLATIDEFNKFLIQNNNLLKGSSKPRCLVLNSCPSNCDTINEILQSFWLEKYLDIMLLTQIQRQRETFVASSKVLLLLSHINPFRKKYSTQVVSSKSEWFPNKQLNLHGYNLNFSCQSINDTTEGEYVKAKKFVEILSQVMNFEYKIIPFVIPFGKLNSEKNESERIKYSKKFGIMFEEVNPEIWLNIASILPYNYKSGENIRILRFDSAKAVIPKMVKLTNTVELSPEFWHMILGTLFIITIIRFTAFFLNFEKTRWQTLNISQIIIGMSTNKEPYNWLERTVFGTLLLTCIIYTSYFFSVILDISLRPASKISNLADLVQSSLTPMMIDALSWLFSNSSIFEHRQLALKSIKIPFQGEEYCLKNLTDHQNVTCILNNAAYFVNTYKVKNGEINVRILQETLGYFVITFMSKQYSPFFDRFNEIILKASEFGLLKNHYREDVHIEDSTLALEFVTKEKLLPILFGVLLIGYSLSIIAFFLEVILVKFRGKF